MTLTAAELAAVVAAMRPRVEGAWVQKIYQTADHTLSILLRRDGANEWLIVSCEPGISHIALADNRTQSDPTPPRFCATARKHLEGGRVVEIDSVPGDRVATVAVERVDGVKTLVAELFGRHGNLFLIDAEGCVLDASRAGSGPRATKPGEVYGPPPPSKSPGTAAIRDFGPGDLAHAVGRFYDHERERARIESVRRELTTVARKNAKRSREFLAKLENEARAIGDPEKARADADHLAASMHLIRKGMDHVEIEDWYGGPPRRIALDPKWGASEQVAQMFARIRRAKRKKAALDQQIPEAQSRADAAQEFLREVEGAKDEDLDTLKARAESEGRLPRKAPGSTLSAKNSAGKANSPQPSGPKRFVARDGSVIIVGRTARENDEVTFRVAQGNDWWFHVSGQSGSHVVVKVPSGASLSSETLLDAATLAVQGSKLARQGSGEVLYTQRKYVRKPKGAPPGRVIAEQTKTVFVRVDDERVKRLADSRG